MTTNLIIGGTGKTGRRVTALLQGRGFPVISLSRPAFDWADPATWSAVERPADAAYLTFAPDLAFPGAPEAVAEVAERMARSGVRRIVLLSGRGEPLAQAAERMVVQAAQRYGAEAGVVRCAFFMQNFDESFFVEPLAAGNLAFLAGEAREPFVDLDDVAHVVMGMMRGEIPLAVRELTGPRLMTFAEATQEIAHALGRPITYEQVSAERFVADLVDVGLPSEEAGALADLFGDILDGHNAHLTDGMREATGAPARDFMEYAARAAAAGAWGGRVAVS